MIGSHNEQSFAHLAHFGLVQNPFAPGPVATLHYYRDPSRDRILTELHHLLPKGEDTLLVVGVDHSGKTALAEYVLQQAAENWKVCRVDAAKFEDPNALFTPIATCFGMEGQNSSSIAVLEGLARHINQQLHGLVPILIIDNADTLDADALEAMLRLTELRNTQGGSLLRLILLARPEINAVLRAPRFRALTKLHRFELSALDQAQTAAYLAHRLHGAGFGGDNPFNDKDLQLIHQNSDGLPGNINEVADELLQFKARHRFPLGLNAPQFAALTAGVLLLGLLILFWEPAEEPIVPAAPVPTEPPPQVSAKPERPPEPLTRLEPLEPFEARAPQAPQEQPAPPTEPVSDAMPALASEEDAPPPPPEVLPIPSAKPPASPAKVAALDQPEPTEPELLGEIWLGAQPDDYYTLQLLANAQLAGLQAFVHTHHLPPPLATVANLRQGQALYLLLHGSYADRPAAEAALARLPEAVRAGRPWIRHFADIRQGLPHTTAAPASVTDPQTEAWLWDQDPNHYTIQLVGSSKREAVDSLLHTLPPGQAAAIYRSQRQGQAWYIGLMGAYPDRAGAEAALKTLPETLRGASPWVRPFGAIHGELAAQSR